MYSIRAKKPSDVVIVCALRTPMCKARRGLFKDTTPDYLLSCVFKGVLERTGIDPALVEDIVVGSSGTPGNGANITRMAVLHAGFPEETSSMAVNRRCASGLQAVAQTASSISDGTIEVGIGAGVESMTMFFGPRSTITAKDTCEEMMGVPSAVDCLLPMGLTSENVSNDFGIKRKEMDEFSAHSHQKAAAAQAAGLFKDEIIPVVTTVKDKDGNVRRVVVTEDEGIRKETTAESLGKLKPAFTKEGSTTAGNSSQVTDGAAAVLMMTRRKANELGLPIIGRYVAAAYVGVPPRIMGVGPAYAIPEAVKKAGITIGDIELIELNEAFASQALYCIKKLNLDINKVNPKGGAIALGHPLGCTGARQIATLLNELKRQNKTIGATSMCMGSGMGMCAIFTAEY
ncbi:hypothetical protein BB559_005704 [Furculomyces boomerangus]|uniref:Uncharacterized protein n=1 Tax=Furculomyces boomerangus TaxID=61424 RepID=A0A2T9Y734_9FUNG|nr:hypothetical protein BB559_005704 [Furculomyces boomerangus]